MKLENNFLIHFENNLESMKPCEFVFDYVI